jgi:anti-sigma B factor antagonist
VGERALDEHTAEIVVAGELDLATAPRLKWSLVDSLNAGRNRLLVNLSEVTFIDSTALSVLVGVHRKLGEHEHMAVVCTNSNVLRIFEVAGLKVAFEIFPTTEQALSYLDDAGSSGA